ncbi:MAG: hypothetical protein KGO53_04400 [Alphaproteobacteria bacterium]|nr:hypothetical protein [Alphaproteobacteria bacterium]
MAPAFFALAFAIFYAGWTALDMNTVHFAVVDAGRALQLNPKLTQDQLQTMVSSRVKGLSGGSGVTVTLTPGAVVNGAQIDTAAATYPLSFTIPLVGTYTYNYSTSVNVVVYAS